MVDRNSHAAAMHPSRLQGQKAQEALDRARDGVDVARLRVVGQGGFRCDLDRFLTQNFGVILRPRQVFENFDPKSAANRTKSRAPQRSDARHSPWGPLRVSGAQAPSGDPPALAALASGAVQRHGRSSPRLLEVPLCMSMHGYCIQIPTPLLGITRVGSWRPCVAASLWHGMPLRGRGKWMQRRYRPPSLAHTRAAQFSQ